MKKAAIFYKRQRHKRYSHGDINRRKQNLQRECKSRVPSQAIETVTDFINCSRTVAKPKR
jgi:hypothetical protein